MIVLTSAEHIKIDPDEWKWIMKRQEQYDKRASDFLADRASQGAFDLHNKIVAEIDQLPYEEGGKKCGV